MPRSGITLQSLVFDPGVVTLLSPAVPPPAGGGGPGGGSGGSGGAIGPILGGLLLLFGLLGFPLAASPPPPAPAQVTPVGPAVAQGPSQPGGPPGPAASPSPLPPAPVVSPPLPAVVTPKHGANVAPVEAPGGPAQAVPSSIPRERPLPLKVAQAGPTGPPPRHRPILPFTGANLLTSMAVGVGLIILGLVLRYRGTTAQGTVVSRLDGDDVLG